MEQLSLFSSPPLSVTDLTFYLRELIQSDSLLQNVWVQGEISNLSRPSSGHIYFTLKDRTSALRVVIWRSSAARLRLPLQNGQLVELHGAISIYERDGQYQLYADAVRPAGQGMLYQEYLRLKALLEAEGLFDEERKRPLPALPQRIGLVTSPTGAALQDMLNTLRRRYPLAEIFLSPSAVQGEEAPGQLVAALVALYRLRPPLDVILIARGGGSLEDLWAFNDETVVRTVAASPVPIVSGIGHETDFTLTDFAADVRAPTPTAAAELSTPDQQDLRLVLNRLSTRLDLAVQSELQIQRSQALALERRLQRASPAWALQNERQRLDEVSQRQERVMNHNLALFRERLKGRTSQLNGLNPQAVLRRGYAVLETAGGLVTSVYQVQAGQSLTARLADGQISTTIAQVIPQQAESNLPAGSGTSSINGDSE